MIEFDGSNINGMKCVTVRLTQHYHGPSHTPQISADLVYLTNNKPVGQVTVDDFGDDAVAELAKTLVEHIETEFAKHIGVGGVTKETEKKRESIEGLVKEF